MALIESNSGNTEPGEPGRPPTLPKSLAIGSWSLGTAGALQTHFLSFPLPLQSESWLGCPFRLGSSLLRQEDWCSSVESEVILGPYFQSPEMEEGRCYLSS
jgi:hypothetical protein